MDEPLIAPYAGPEPGVAVRETPKLARPAVRVAEIPYPGLRPFRQDEAHIFFGREGQTDRMLEKLCDNRFLAVVGPSGCGKSSLVRAGLIVGLRTGLLAEAGSSWRVVEMRPGGRPLARLADALLDRPGLGLELGRLPSAADYVLASLRRGPLSILELVGQASLPPRTNVLVLVDQFEELFRYRSEGNRDEAEAFVGMLLATATQREIPVCVVITMRSDHLGDCLAFRGLPEAINESQYLTPTLTHDELRAAIERPARVRRGSIHPEVVNRLLREAGNAPDQLPLLQHALMRMWLLAADRARADSDAPSASAVVEVTIDDYRSVGGLTEALSRHLDEIYAGLGARQPIARVLFQCLSERDTGAREIRHPTPLGRVARVAGVPLQEVVAVVEAFRAPGRCFLIPPADRPLAAETILDISHESLIRQWHELKKPDGWLDEEARAAATYRRLLDTARERKGEGASLWGGRDLERGLEWLERVSGRKGLAGAGEAAAGLGRAEAWALRYGSDADFGLALDFVRESEEADRLAKEAERTAREEKERIEREAQRERLRSEANAARLAYERQARRFLAGLLVALVAALGFAAYKWNEAADLQKLAETSAADERTAATEASKARDEATALRKEAEERAILEGSLRKHSEESEVRAKAARDSALRLSSSLAQLEAERHIEQDKADVGLAYLARAVTVYPGNPSARASGLAWAIYGGFPRVLVELSHSGHVLSAASSPDGRRVVTVSDDRTARVWDAATGTALGEPMRHEGEVRSAVFSSDGNRVVTASDDRTARVWDAASGNALGESMRHQEVVQSAVFSADGSRLVTASSDRTARVWDAATGTALGEPMRHEGEVRSAVFSSDGSRVVTASGDGTARVWDATTGKPRGEAMRHPAGVQSAVFSPDGRRVVTASEDRIARVWDAATGKVLGAVMWHSGAVRSAVFSPNGQKVITASSDRTARLWDAETGRPLGEAMRHHAAVRSAVLSPDGRRVLTASEDRTARLWDAGTGKALAEPMRHKGEVVSAVFSSDGHRVVTASLDRTARVWDTKTGTAVGESMRHQDVVQSAVFSPDNRRVVTASWDRSARLWDAASGKALGEPIRHNNNVFSAVFSPDGRWVATASWDHSARVWDAKTGAAVGEPIRHARWVWSAVFSPDGRRVLTASNDGTARLWDAASGRAFGEPMRHKEEVVSAAFSPDGRRAVTASLDRTARVWDAKTGTAVGEPMRHQDVVQSALFSPDSRRVVTASKDGTARLWDAASGKALGEPMRHEEEVVFAVFSPDGRWVATASSDHTARVWDAKTGTAVGQPMRHEREVRSALFSSDGRRVVTASFDHTARVWDAATGKPFGAPLLHGDTVLSAAFSPDGRRVVTASWDHTGRVWDVPPGTTQEEPLLARLLEAVGRHRVDDQGVLEQIPSKRVLELWSELRREAESGPDNDTKRVIRWLLTDPAHRPASPLAMAMPATRAK